MSLIHFLIGRHKRLLNWALVSFALVCVRISGFMHGCSSLCIVLGCSQVIGCLAPVKRLAAISSLK